MEVIHDVTWGTKVAAMNVSIAIGHTKLSALFAYWNTIRGDREMPSRAGFDPAEIPRLLPNIILIDVERNPLRFRIRLYGTAIVAIRGRDLTGRYIDEPKVSNIADLTAQANREVVDTKQPHYMDAPYPHHSRKLGHFYRLGLPLSSDGTEVNMILVGFYQMNNSLALTAPS